MMNPRDRFGSVLARQTDHKRYSADEGETGGPSNLEIEPAPRYKFEAQVCS